MAYAVELKNITKTFPGVVANQKVSMRVEWGSIHGLIGENGAGKTTLMKVLYGMYHPDEGEILIDGHSVHLNSSKDAIEHSIGMVHQHFTLVPSLTVAQNIILGKPICKKSGLLDLEKANKYVEQLGKEYGMPVNPKAHVKDLPVAIQQRVEILKVLYLGADILIMDEPTAVLTPQEIESLLRTLLLLKEKGKSIILITHKLKELMSVTDTITVLRNGVVTGEVETVKANERSIAAMMVGKEISFEVEKAPVDPKEPALEVEHLHYKDKFGVTMLNDVSFCVRQGEILGVAGVQVNGQTELIEVISGMISNYEGKVTFSNHEIKPEDSPLTRRQAGLGHIPEDRQTMGAALGATLTENFIMGGLSDPAYTSPGVISYTRAGDVAKRQYENFDVKYASLNEPAGALSGGNLQKAIVAREIYRDPQILIAAQPSRGVDIGATLFIHRELIKLRECGKAILLVSGELSEVMSLSDRVIVLYNGAIVGEVDPKKSTEEEIGLLMAGMKGGTAS